MTEPTSSSLQPCVDAANDALYVSLSKLEAQLAMIHGSRFDGFASMEPRLQAEYIWTCADLVRDAKAAYVRLETLRSASVPA